MVPEHNNPEAKSNIYTTDIPLFDLMKATPNEWESCNSTLVVIDSEKTLKEKLLDDITDIFIKTIENNVKMQMRLYSNEKPTSFASRNLIPKNVRKAFKRKYKLNKQLRSVKSVNRCI